MKLDNSWINDNSYKIIRSILCYRAGSIFKKVYNLKIKSLISLIFLENLQSINYKQQTVTPFQSAEKWPQGDFALKLYLTIYKYTYLSYCYKSFEGRDCGLFISVLYISLPTCFAHIRNVFTKYLLHCILLKHVLKSFNMRPEKEMALRTLSLLKSAFW